MARKILTTIVLGLLIAAAFANPLFGQAKKGNASGQTGPNGLKTPGISPMEERQFLLYALEDMSRKRPLEFTGQVRWSTSPTVVLSRFVAQQRRLFDRLRRYVQNKQDEEFVGVFRSYEQALDILDEWEKWLGKSSDEINRRLAFVATGAGARLMLTGLSYALQDSRGDGAGPFSGGMSGMLNSFIEEQRNVNKARYLAGQQLTTVIREGDKRFRSQVDNRYDAFRERLKQYVQIHDIASQGFAFSATGTNRTANPFLIVEDSRSVLFRKTASVKEMLDAAKLSRAAAFVVPVGAVYDVFRAQFISVAGLLANQAAAKDIGATGLPLTIKDAPEAGPVARRYWKEYVKVEPFTTNFTDDVLQAYILGHAYAGDLKTANQTVLRNVVANVQLYRVGNIVRQRVLLRNAASAKPNFWYDCARISSIAGNIDLSLECLQLAMRLGFRDRESARISLDLQNVRESPLTTDQFKRILP